METKPNRPTAVLYVHGMGGSPTESEHYRALFPNCDIVGLDYQTFCPEETGKEVRDAALALCADHDRLLVIANSIGAYFSLYADLDGIADEAFFISPVVDLERLMIALLRKEGLDAADLKERGSFRTHTGIGLYWKDVVYIRENPYRWHVPTHILYGAADRLIPYDAITTFADAHGADVTVLEDGKHWFHTDEQMAFLDGWIRSLQR